MDLFSFVTSQSAENLAVLFQWKFVILPCILFASFYYLRRAKSSRSDLKQYSHFPQPEERDPVRGHWPWVEKAAALGDARRTFDEILYEEAEKLDFPPVLLVDLRPLEKFLLLLILDNDVAEQVTKSSKQYTTSVPKHPSIQRLAPLVGARSLVTTDVSMQSGF